MMISYYNSFRKSRGFISDRAFRVDDAGVIFVLRVDGGQTPIPFQPSTRDA
jgi:hypothetical protein